MKMILDRIRKNKGLHNVLRKSYGKTLGLWWLKEWYAKNIGFYNGEERIRLLNNKEGNKIIIDEIESNKPFMLARYGSTEFRNIFEDNLDNLCLYSGFFPNDSKLLKKFRDEYFKSSRQIDFLCVWNYRSHFFKKRKLIKNFPNIKKLFGLSVTNYDQSWIRSLKGKKVLVIHPFKKSIDAQYKKRKELGILPELKSFEVIKAVQTLAGNKDERFEAWFDALEFMKKEIDKKDFDIAIIGCGAYGLPLAAHVKSIKRQALHLGGSSQLLFGIRGKRWIEMGYKFNKYWISPLKEDMMTDAKKIEGGCYW